MPKLKAPLQSFHATGSLDRSITFQGGLAPHRAIRFPTHKDADSIPQRHRRLLYLAAKDEWLRLSDPAKATYESNARKHHITGYNLFMREFLTLKYQGPTRLLMTFQAGAGAILLDRTGYLANANIAGPAWAYAPSGARCLLFNGASDYCEIPSTFDQLDFTAEDFSLICRVRVDDLSTHRSLFRRGLWGADGYYFWIFKDGYLEVITAQAGSTQWSYSTIGGLLINTWYTLGFSRDGEDVTLFVNGADDTQHHGTHLDPDPCSRSAKIGIHDNKIGNPFDGPVAFLFVIARALSPREHLIWHNRLGHLYH